MSIFNNWERINWDIEDRSVLTFSLGNIKHFLSQPISAENFFSCFQQCLFFFNHFPLPIFELRNERILRARENFGGEIFSHQYEISYNKACPNRSSLGRFNRPMESVFYGALSSGIETIKYTATSMAESGRLFDELNLAPISYYTIGTWTMKPFIVVCLCFDEKHLKLNKLMSDYIHSFKTGISENCSMENAEFILNTLHFFSNLTSTPSSNDGIHLVTTAMFCAMREVYYNLGEEVNGIVYPSSKMESEGLNIVLTQDTVDNYLSLEKVIMYQIDRDHNDSHQLEIYPITKEEAVIERRFLFSEIQDQRPFMTL